MFIDPQRSWLAASPDGIVMDAQTGQRLLCLEVKCPYKHRDRRVEEACRIDAAFCLQTLEPDGRRPGEVRNLYRPPSSLPRCVLPQLISDISWCLSQAPAYCLKKTHSYYTQIQCQLAVTGLQQADLVVFTRQETAIVPVTFDAQFWEETVSKLAVFHTGAVLPHLRKKMMDEAATLEREM